MTLDFDKLELEMRLHEEADPVQRYMKWLREMKPRDEFPSWALEDAEKALRMRNECCEHLSAMFAAPVGPPGAVMWDGYEHARWLAKNASEAVHLWRNLMWNVRRFLEREPPPPIVVKKTT